MESLSILSRGLLRNSYKPAALCCKRNASSSAYSTVELDFTKLVPSHGDDKHRPLVILHGLLGSKRNWQSLAKAFHRDLPHRAVYTLDLRNHGSSPHARPMSYPAMAADVLRFCREHSLSNISLLGHSMGGKVAMTVALNPELPDGLLSQLIVADIAPSKGPLSPEFTGYMEAMNKIEASNVYSRQEAQEILKPYEPDPMTRAFLLTNLDTHSHTHDKPLRFKIPMDIISTCLDEIGSFPYNPGERTWDHPTLFIKGTKSRYINDRNLPIAKQFFPQMQMELLDAGHWVHSERPNEFRALVTHFIKTH